MEGREHSPETVFRAQELYCVDRLSYDKVADRIAQEIEPVAVSTLKRWGQTYGWSDKRTELAQALADISADTIMARSKLLKALMTSPDAQTAFAVSAMESLAMKQAEAVRAGRMAEASARFELREIKTTEDAIRAMREAAELKLNRMLTGSDEFDFRKLQEVKKGLDYVDDLEKAATGSAGAEEAKGLSPETADAIRREILGIK